MIELLWDSGFKKRYRKKVKGNKILKENFWSSIYIFCSNPFDPLLKTHKLTGKLKGLWAFSCGEDCRVIFKFIDEKKVLLIDIGKHEEVY